MVTINLQWVRTAEQEILVEATTPRIWQMADGGVVGSHLGGNLRKVISTKYQGSTFDTSSADKEIYGINTPLGGKRIAEDNAIRHAFHATLPQWKEGTVWELRNLIFIITDNQGNHSKWK